MKKSFFSGWTKYKTISYGLVYVLFNLWVLFHIENYFPAEQLDYWFKVMVSYFLLNLFIWANAGLRNKLFNVRFTNFFPRFMFFFTVGLFLFYFVLQKFDPFDVTKYEFLTKVPLWLGLIHTLTIATTESLVWQGYLDDKIGKPASALTAGLFHLGVWSGSAVMVVLSAGALFMVFSYVNWYYRVNKNDLAPAIAIHTAFNVAKLGLFVMGGGLL